MYGWRGWSQNCKRSYSGHREPERMQRSEDHPKLLPSGENAQVYERFRAELETLRARQRQIEQEHERLREREQKHSEKAGENENGGDPQSSEAHQDNKPEPPPKPPMRERIARIPREHPVGLAIGLIAVTALLIGGFFLWHYLQSYESTDDAQIDGHLNAIGPRISGTVIGVYTENNRSVLAGQTLIDLDPRDYEVELAQAEGNFAQAQSQLAAENPNVPITETSNVSAVATAQAGVASAEQAVAAAQRDYDSAVAETRQAEATNRKAQADELRYRLLVAKEEVPRELYDERRAAAESGAAAVDAARARAEAARRAIAEQQASLEQARTQLAEARANNPRQLTARRATVSAREAAVKAAAAQVARAKLDLSYCKILAPVAGVIGDKNVEVGQHVQAGEQLLAITQIEDLWVTANFKETQIARMRPGQPVSIHVDAINSDFNGYVQNMPGATGAKYSLLPPENATGNFVKVVQRLPVRIRFKNGQSGLDRLRPGMSVEPKVWLR